MRRESLVRTLALAITLGVAVAVDLLVPARTRAPAPEAAGAFVSAAWYCSMPGGEGVTAAVSTTNAGAGPITVRRWAASGSQATPFQGGDVGPGGRTSARAGDMGVPEGVGVVEVFGAATVSETVATAPGSGVARSRCSVQPWTRWYFSSASTARGQNTYLLVANPFREEAVVRVRLVTPETDTVPARLKDIVVPQLSQTAVFLSDYYPETASFGVEVSAIRGRVLVSRFSRVSTRDGLRGLDLDLGAREPSTRWQFAWGEVPADGDETLLLVNPGERESLVQVIFQTEGEQVAPPGLREVAVPAGRQVQVKVPEHLPRGTRHATSVVSTNKVPIVAERQTVTVLGGGRKIESSLGATAAARRWSVPAGSPAGGSEVLAVVNTDANAAVYSIRIIGEKGEVRPPELASLSLEPGRLALYDLTPHLGGGPATAVVETSSGLVTAGGHLVVGEPYRDLDDTAGARF